MRIQWGDGESGSSSNAWMIQNTAFPEALGTFSNSPRSNISLMLYMVNYHLYANVYVYALHIA